MVKVLITSVFLIALGTIILNKEGSIKILDNINNLVVNNKIKVPDNYTQIPQEINQNITQVNNTIDYIFSENNPLVCNYNYKNNNQDVKGELFIFENKILNKTSYNNQNNKEVINNHLYNNGYVYLWGEDSVNLKINVPNIFNDNSEKSNTLKQLGINTGLNLICNKWVEVDTKVLEPPEDVNFIDPEKNINQIKNTLDNTSYQINNKVNNLCEMCYLAPTENLINKCLEVSNCAK